MEGKVLPPAVHKQAHRQRKEGKSKCIVKEGMKGTGGAQGPGHETLRNKNRADHYLALPLLAAASFGAIVCCAGHCRRAGLRRRKRGERRVRRVVESW